LTHPRIYRRDTDRLLRIQGGYGNSRKQQSFLHIERFVTLRAASIMR